LWIGVTPPTASVIDIVRLVPRWPLSAPCGRPAKELQGRRRPYSVTRDCVFHRVALADTRI
jgi:hypothetical protein